MQVCLLQWDSGLTDKKRKEKARPALYQIAGLGVKY